MKRYVFWAYLVSAFIIFASCEKEKQPELCTLYGTVTDKATGEPIKTAGVELLPVGKKSVTGSDGAFEFVELEEGIYKLFITKSGYKDYTSNDVVVKASSEKVSHSIQLEKLPPALTVIDDNKNEIDSIEFGSDEGTIMRSFNIFNNGEDKLEWQIIYQCNWIDTISKTSGELKANATQSIVITIDRLKLNVGDNSTVIHIVSNNGSKQLTITAKSVNIIETLEASDVGGVRAVLNAKVVRDLNPSIIEYGFVYNTMPAPRLTNAAKKVSQTGTPKIGLYNMLVEGLENYTKYYACAFVLNRIDTIYGEQIDFETVSHIPAIKNLKNTQKQAKSFTIEYEVNDGGLALDEVGVCWSTTPISTKEDDNYKKTGNEAKKYSTKISGLTPNTTYYVRVYAHNSESEIYSTQIQITTLDGYATVLTDSVVTDISSIKATCGGNVTDDGTLIVIARGICYGKEQQPDIEGTHTTEGTGKGTFSSKLRNLEDNTTYYFRAYATTEVGTAYGKQYSFLTKDGTPVVELISIKDTTANSVTCEGNVTGDGGVSVTERGFCYSTAQYPTNISEHIVVGNNMGKYSGSLTGLVPNTTYYVRAYAVNSLGVGYSEQQSFTTKDGLPRVSTGQATVTATTITAGGEITDNGGFAVTERGVCYSTTNSEPSIADDKIMGGQGDGVFNVSITNLSATTTYYIRAYATNKNGTSYGKTIPVVTKEGRALVRISDVESVTALTALCSVTVTDADGATLQECGICWSINPTPCISDSVVKAQGKQVGIAYPCKMLNLWPNTSYYVCGYAITNITTSYSQPIPFKTTTGLPGVGTGSATSTASSITIAGEVTGNGGYAVTERGICYSATNAEPTISDKKVTSGSGNGSFSASISNLESATIYYIRAYATNSIGTSYGNTISVTTKDGSATVTLGEITNVTALTATGSVTVTDAGGATLQSCGICWSMNPNPTVDDNKASASGKQVNTTYTCNMVELQPNTTYYVRAYATTDITTSYSKQLPFKTTTGLPIVETGSATPTASTITIAGEVTSNGGYAVTERGVCYSATNAEPTISDKKVTSGSGNGSFSASISNLESATTYYIRAYATNSIGTSYGNTISVTTKDGSATVTLGEITNITALTATGSVTVTDAGGATLQSCGICWSMNPYPTTGDSSAVAGGKQLNTAYTCNISNLQPNTTYYIRAYATTDITTSYSEQVTFKTTTGLPVVETGSATPTASTITIAGEVTSNGGYAVTERGVCYSATNAEPTISDKKVTSGSGNGSFSASISNLEAATTYYIRAYATNSIGTSYGNTISVTTKDGSATVTLGEITNITALTATGSVTVTDAGGSTLQSCGICWSINPNPTIDDNITEASGKQTNTAYTCKMSALTPNTQYYVRGYATTDVTTVYSGDKSFTTKEGLPELTTSTTTATSTTVTSGGKIINDGGYAITERGVCYSTTNSSPTLSDTHVSNGSGIGEYTCIITNVSVNTTYYVCAYATNSIGTKYGDVQTVTTGNGLPIVKTTTIGENVTETTAIGGGQVEDDGGYAVTSRGVCWSTLPNPTIADNKTTDGSGKGYFTSNITGIDLTGSNVYYVRAYATNANGTTYGSSVLISKENLDYAQLPSFQYGGYTYKLYPDMGTMTNDDAVLACENLVYGGYDDWFLPNYNELKAGYNATKEGWITDSYEVYSNYIYLTSKYWTYDESKCYYAFLEVYKYTSGNTYNISRSSSLCTATYRVRPVRKYLANQ